MANITLKDSIGSSNIGAILFDDSESFMQDLSQDEIDLKGGGLKRPQPTARETIFPIKYPMPTPPVRFLP
jgi:hypothetical protein